MVMLKGNFLAALFSNLSYIVVPGAFCVNVYWVDEGSHIGDKTNGERKFLSYSCSRKTLSS